MRENIDQVIKTDVLVLGGGAAGVRAAIEVRRKDLRVLIVSTFKAGYANNTAISYGGFAATADDIDRGDSQERHHEDTIKGGYGLNRHFLVRLMTDQAWHQVKALEEMGVRFQKEGNGSHIRLARGGHSVARRVATPNSSGVALLAPLVKYGKPLNIEELNGWKAVHLLTKDRQICGALCINRAGELSAIAAKSVILATGGGGALYPESSNVRDATGDGYALAYQSGLALQDMEFVQFVVMGLREPGVPKRLPPIEVFLMKGAELKGLRGQPLLDGSSFTRDAIAQAIAKEVSRSEAGRDFVYLDLKGLRWHEMGQIPGLRGDIIKVYPAAHFFMGGVRVDEKLRTPIEGLYVAGEVMGGVHGANRLGGNALAEAFVFGANAGSAAAGFVRRCGDRQLFHRKQARQAACEIVERFNSNEGGMRSTPSLTQLDTELRDTMGAFAGVIRDQGKLEHGIRQIESIKEAFSLLPCDEPRDLWPLLTLQSKITVSEMILRCAMKREESRGAHYREDFPFQDDDNWLVNICVVQDDNDQMALSLEPVKPA